MIWSIVVPACTSAPAVFFGLSHDMNAAATQWSAPVTPGGGSAERACRPLMTTRSSFSFGSNAFQMSGNSLPSFPVVCGIQWPGPAPCGTIKPTNRCFGAAAVCASAVRAGTMASRKGSASAAPAPRRTVRRGMCFFVINMMNVSPLLTSRPLSSGGGCGWLHVHLEHLVLDDAQHERREAVVARLGLANDGAHDGHVVVLDAAAERIGQQALG